MVQSGGRETKTVPAMNEDFPRNWMWSEACEMLARAERLHQQFFEPQRAPSRLPAWEPPVDILETPHEVVVFAAVPGVDPGQVETVIEGAHLVLSGTRALPRELATAIIHRLELPQGRFSRRIALPPGRYSGVRRTSIDGCLVITLQKTEDARG
jgi:HSP20 family molecular chaperone IbpA